MATNPETTEKMRAEVLHYCGTDTMPTIDHIHQLRYSKLTIPPLIGLSFPTTEISFFSPRSHKRNPPPLSSSTPECPGVAVRTMSPSTFRPFLLLSRPKIPANTIVRACQHAHHVPPSPHTTQPGALGTRCRSIQARKVVGPRDASKV